VRLPLHSFSLINWLCAWVELVSELLVGRNWCFAFSSVLQNLLFVCK
jgi:hypothetical protein